MPSSSDSSLPPDPPRNWRSGSLVGQVLRRVAFWSSLLVLGVSFVAYWFSYQNAREEALRDVVSLADERGRAATEPLGDAVAQMERFSDAFLAAYRNPSVGDSGRFESLFEPDGQGALRLRPDYFEGTVDSRELPVSGVSAFIGRDRPPLDNELQRRLVILVDLVARFGPAWGAPVSNTHVTLPENALLMYWPEQPWGLNARPGLDITEGGVVSATLPENNPDREPVWSALYHDHTAGQWTITYQRPVDLDGRHLANPSQDILLGDIIERLAASAFPGSRTMLIGPEGELIGDLALRNETMAAADLLNVEDLDDPLPARIFRALQRTGIGPGARVLEERIADHYVAVTRIPGPDWFFIALYPQDRVASEAHRAGGVILGTGVLLQALLLAVLSMVMRRRVRRPVRQLSEAVRHISRRDYEPVVAGHIPLPLDQPNEMGELARTLQDMSGTVSRRQEQLEADVLARTEKLAIANRQLATLAQTDRLTNLPNRRALDQDIDSLKGSERVEAVAIGMLDIDHFKSFNDSLGHAAGDEALRKVARILAGQQRPNIRAYRYGGEEFCMIFTDSAVPHCRKILETVLAELEAAGIPHPSAESEVVTLSAGLAICESVSHIKDCLDAADQALFRAKRAGRRRVVDYKD